ncbi:phosphoribosylamine--glycine ligase [Acidithiobacillus sp. IBUN Pt1247-S3]|uniref:phosphoribosylamine--glycine ligase n=1 Tax=Acidithiobacillus sp. IBUN Pt1247-S3 TaxID=3166642 RepID=UPI0034E5DDA4
MQKVMVLGSGGREHAIAWKLAQSNEVGEVLCVPGNPGTEHEPKCRNLRVSPLDSAAVVAVAHGEGVSLVVIGPEAPLVAGVPDALRRSGIPVFGPNAAAARLEGSKAFAKEFMERHGIPTAAYGRFTSLAAGREFLQGCALPIVVKADGLASGKGVVIASTRAEAEEALARFLAWGPVLLEEFLEGEEASFIAIISDGQVLPLAGSQDHKRLLDADQGPNTGGMGAYSPAPILDAAMSERVRREVMQPMARALQKESLSYRGFLYAGVMVTSAGPKVLEFNCRLGDPETQPLLFRLRSDLYPVLYAAALAEPLPASLDWDPRTALCVVLAAPGYPEAAQIGAPILGLPKQEPADAKIFHAGTRAQDGGIVTAGGRVLGVTALGDSVASAQQVAYALADKIRWPGKQLRSDIGWRARGRG